MWHKVEQGQEACTAAVLHKSCIKVNGTCTTWISPWRNVKIFRRSCPPLWKWIEYEHRATPQLWCTIAYVGFSHDHILVKALKYYVPQVKPGVFFRNRLPYGISSGKMLKADGISIWLGKMCSIWNIHIRSRAYCSALAYPSCFSASHIVLKHHAVHQQKRNGGSKKYLTKNEHSCVNDIVPGHSAQAYT